MLYLFEWLLDLLARALDRRTFKGAMTVAQLRRADPDVLHVGVGAADVERAFGLKSGLYRSYYLTSGESAVYGSRRFGDAPWEVVRRLR